MMPLHKHYIGPILGLNRPDIGCVMLPVMCQYGAVIYIGTYTGPILGLNRPNIGCVMVDSNVPVYESVTIV